MAIKADKEKTLLEFGERAWNWLRKLSSYQRDYDAWQKLVRKNLLLEYEIRERYSKVEEGAEIVTGYYAHISPYYLRYSRSLPYPKSLAKRGNVYAQAKKMRSAIPRDKISKQAFGQQQEIKKKWGFYPLINPKNPWSFYSPFGIYFSKIFADGRFCPCVKLAESATHKVKEYRNYLTRLAKWKKLRKRGRPIFLKPKTIELIIDCRLHDGVIVAQLKRILKSVRNTYKIKATRPNEGYALDIFKAQILKNMGMSEKQVAASLIPHKSYANHSPTMFLNHQEAARMKRYRRRISLSK